jgi:hypothetical protein
MSRRRYCCANLLGEELLTVVRFQSPILMKLRNVKFHDNSFNLDWTCICSSFGGGGNWLFQITVQSDQLRKLESEYPLTGSNQFVAFQQELPRRLSGTGQTETIKILWIPNRAQTDKGTHTRTLCRKKQGSVLIKHKLVTVSVRTTDRTLSSEMTSLQNDIDG